jgi:hypothetical protein
MPPVGNIPGEGADPDPEGDQQQDAEPELGHGVQGQRRPQRQPVEHAPPPPGPPDAHPQSDHGRQHGGQAEQQHRGPDPLADHLRDRPAELVGDAEVALEGVAHVGGELLGQRPAQPEALAQDLDLLGRDQAVAGQVLGRVAGQDPEQEEVEHQHEGQAEHRPDQLGPEPALAGGEGEAP